MWTTSLYFFESTSDIDSVKAHLNSKLTMKYIENTSQLLEIEPSCKPRKHILCSQLKLIEK